MRIAAGLVLGMLAGCLEVPAGPGQECRVDADCDAGEVCGEGLCWGAPPAGMFAATLSAPATREDLIATELALLELPADGWLGDVQLEAPVTISGRVEAYCPSANQSCSTLSIGAEVRVTRPARFPGGPALRFSAQSVADTPRGTDSFTLRVPRTRPGDPPYIVTIDPDGGGQEPATNGAVEPAELVPPRRFTLHATENVEHQTYTLGGPDAKLITGTLRDALNQPLVGYRILALGRWEDSATPSVVSTVDFSTDGTYAIAIDEHALGPLEIVASPYGDSHVAPTLRVKQITAATQQLNIMQPTGFGERADIEVPIQGLAGDGEVRLIAGVRVIVTATLEPIFPGGTLAAFTAEATTGEDGIARLSLLHGAALASAYRLRVVPPAGSSFGVIDNRPIELADLAVPVRLPTRIALRGKVVDAWGTPLSAVSVTARRSVRFLWSLKSADQPFLDEIPTATTITPESGEFVVWVDPAVSGVWGHYDLFFEPPASSGAPSWWISDLAVPRVPDQSTLSLDTITLPDAARLRARVVDGNGKPIQASALRVFQVTSNELICSEVGFEPSECTPASVVVGTGESDEDGIVRFRLPRP